MGGCGAVFILPPAFGSQIVVCNVSAMRRMPAYIIIPGSSTRGTRASRCSNDLIMYVTPDAKPRIARGKEIRETAIWGPTLPVHGLTGGPYFRVTGADMWKLHSLYWLY
jgi:hypothetical protein